MDSFMITRALIVRPPFAGQIVDGEKVWEMRSRATGIRERIGIIEAGTGLIIGEVDLLDCFGNLDIQQLANNRDKHRIGDLNLLVKWNYAWKLGFSKRYETPVKYAHPRGAVTWVRVDNTI